MPTSFEVEFDAFIGGGTSPLDDPHRLDMAERDYEPIGGNGLALVYGILTSQPYDRGPIIATCIGRTSRTTATRADDGDGGRDAVPRHEEPEGAADDIRTGTPSALAPAPAST